MIGDSISIRLASQYCSRRCAIQLLHSQRSATTSVRHLSSSASLNKDDGPWSEPITEGLNRYVVIAEDHAGPGALARRLEVRDRHLEQAKKGKESGRIEVGGGLLKRDFMDIDEEVGPASSLVGSMFVVLGKSIKDVHARLEQDEYFRAGVFDPSKTRVFPFLRAALGEPATKPVVKEDISLLSIRRPKGESSIKVSQTNRKEVFVKDPRASGKGMNTADRVSIENTLGHLRNTQARSAINLESLRKLPALTQRSEESQ